MKLNKMILDEASRFLSDKHIGELYRRDAAGQKEHGGVDREELYSGNWRKEASDELIDAVWYLTALIISKPKSKDLLNWQASRLCVVDALELLDRDKNNEIQNDYS